MVLLVEIVQKVDCLPGKRVVGLGLDGTKCKVKALGTGTAKKSKGKAYKGVSKQEGRYISADFQADADCCGL